MSIPIDETTLVEFESLIRGHIYYRKLTGRALLVKDAGEAQVVVLSAEAYDQLLDDAEHSQCLRMLDEGMADVQAGRTQSARQALGEIASELGLYKPR